jgi:hypothetical protein
MNHAMAAKAPPGYGRNQSKQTAIKLWLAVVSANVIGLFAAVYVSGFLRAGSGDPNTLFVVYYGAMVVAGIVDAFWLDELLFKGAFRRSMQGKTGASVGKNAPVEEVAASMQRPAISFPVVVIACCLITYGLFNLVNRGFNSWWRDVGVHVHTLRSPTSSTAAQKQAIVELSKDKIPEVLPILEAELTDGDPEVEGWAAWAIGRQKDNPIMNSNRLPPLVERVRNGEPQAKREALIALARLQHQAIADEVQDALAEELASGEAVDYRLIWGLGYLQHPDSLAVLDKALYHPDADVQRLAAWALGQQRDSGKGRDAADLLEQRLPSAPIATKCAIVHALGVLTDERSNLALMHALDSVPQEQHKFLCELISVAASPDRKFDGEDLLAPRDRYAMKTLQSMGGMRATTPEIREQVEPWLERMIAAPETDPLIRESAQSLLTGIREQRNDSSKPE